MKIPRVEVRFCVDDELFAVRFDWLHIPRKGDEVMLGPEKAKLPYRVVRVVWGVEGPEPYDSQQAVNIELKRLPTSAQEPS